MRAIDADEVRKMAVPHTRGSHGYCADIRKWAVLVGDIDDAPTIDPDTLRPTGRWEEEDERSAYYGRLVSCSECGGLLETHKKQYFKYCYNCGAKMMEG